MNVSLMGTIGFSMRSDDDRHIIFAQKLTAGASKRISDGPLHQFLHLIPSWADAPPLGGPSPIKLRWEQCPYFSEGETGDFHPRIRCMPNLRTLDG
jgi:hypothetical protein